MGVRGGPRGKITIRSRFVLGVSSPAVVFFCAAREQEMAHGTQVWRASFSQRVRKATSRIYKASQEPPAYGHSQRNDCSTKLARATATDNPTQPTVCTGDGWGRVKPVNSTTAASCADR